MGYNIASAALILFMLWLLYEAWRAPMYRENEDGSYTQLTAPKKLSDLFKSFKK
jgi:hypothetical protein